MSAYNLNELYTAYGKDEKRLCQAIEELATQYGDKVYQQLLCELFNRPFSAAGAARYWHETMDLHPPGSGRLNHRSALLNYLFFHTDELNDPRIIEASALRNLHRAAICDGLTGLYNQTYFKRKLEELLTGGAAVLQNGFSLILLDLDHFKQFNDRCGHLRGDRALREVARLISAQLPAGALAARYGGEEFALLLPGVDLQGAISLGDQIRRSVAETPISGEKRLDLGKLTISGGIASYPSSGTSATSLIAYADSRLYEAKIPRNCILPQPNDTRGLIRRTLHNIVELRSTQAGPFKSSLSNDISYSGILLKTDQGHEPGKQVEMRFPAPFWPMEHTSLGHVRHVRSNADSNNFLIGIEFARTEVDFIEKVLPHDLY